MEEYSYTSTHPLGHIGPVTGKLYLYLYVLFAYSYLETTGVVLKYQEVQEFIDGRFCSRFGAHTKRYVAI